ncbi:DUF1722 domain-containing protein [Gammaproteobacteria bacterium]
MNPDTQTKSISINLGVSACLLGECVRYDGGHKHNRYITDTLSKVFHLVAVCPEVESGMSTPREAMRLEGDPSAPRLVTHQTKIDKTEQMLEYCGRKVKSLEKEGLSGFIFKEKSPSSGLYQVKVYGVSGVPIQNGRGLFAAAVARHFPWLPLEEADRLNDPAIRENFIERIFSYHRWQDFLMTEPRLGDLINFHTRHKLLIMAHSPELYKEMGGVVAGRKLLTHMQLLDRYQELFMKALTEIASIGRNINVLQHIMGYFKNELTSWEKTELLAAMERYHAHQVPLLVPLTLLKHYVGKYDQQYLQEQIYLTPHPTELMLQNHA